MPVRIEIGLGDPLAGGLQTQDLLAEDLAARDTAARIVGYDWNRNSEARLLKSSTLYIAHDLADVAVVVSTKVRRIILANYSFNKTLYREKLFRRIKR